MDEGSRQIGAANTRQILIRPLTVRVHEGDDHGVGVRHHLAAVHLPASVPLLGEVDLQLVEQRVHVHLRQVGDQNTPRTNLSVDLPTEQQISDGCSDPTRPRTLPRVLLTFLFFFIY